MELIALYVEAKQLRDHPYSHDVQFNTLIRPHEALLMDMNETISFYYVNASMTVQQSPAERIQATFGGNYMQIRGSRYCQIEMKIHLNRNEFDVFIQKRSARSLRLETEHFSADVVIQSIDYERDYIIDGGYINIVFQSGEIEYKK